MLEQYLDVRPGLAESDGAHGGRLYPVGTGDGRSPLSSIHTSAGLDHGLFRHLRHSVPFSVAYAAVLSAILVVLFARARRDVSRIHAPLMPTPTEVSRLEAFGHKPMSHLPGDLRSEDAPALSGRGPASCVSERVSVVGPYDAVIRIREFGEEALTGTLFDESRHGRRSPQPLPSTHATRAVSMLIPSPDRATTSNHDACSHVCRVHGMGGER